MRSIDSETSLIQSGFLAPPLACVTWCDSIEEDPGLLHVKDPACKRLVEETLCMPHVGANIPYDLAVFGAQWPDLMPLIFESLDCNMAHDVIIRQKLFDIGDGCYRGQEVDEGGDTPVYRSFRYSLSDLHQRYFGEHMEKDKWRLTYGLARHRPLHEWTEGQKQYAKTDATAALKVLQRQLVNPKLRTRPEAYLEHETFQVRASFCLNLISCWGFKTDSREVRRFLRALAADQEVRREHLIKERLVRPDGSRIMNDAKALMRATMGDGCTLTDTGTDKYRDWWKACAKAKISVTDELKTLEKRRLFEHGYVSLASATCLMTGNEVLLEFARYGQHQLLTSKVQKLFTTGVPIQTRFEDLLETTRTSSSASKLIPNSAAIQNLPRKVGMRECFVPRNCDMRLPRNVRRVLLSRDFGMAELVALGQIMFKLFGYSKLRDALNAGRDPHLELAAMFLNISYEEAKARKNEPLLVEFRTMAKAFNFGKPGGLGTDKFIIWAKITYGVKFDDNPLQTPKERVQELTKIYFQKYPEIKEYLAYIGRLCDNKEGKCDIRHWKSNHLRGRIQYTVAANSGFQTLTAFGFKASLWEVTRRCYLGVRVSGRMKTAVFEPTHLTGNRVVAPVHDELVLEAREEDAHEIDQELGQVMEQEFQQWVPDVLITTEGSMTRRWRKGAKPVKRNGRLIPYEDACMEALFGFFARCVKQSEGIAA